MAHPLFTPYQSVTPQTNATPNMNIQASPEDFGAPLFRAQEKLGQSLEKVSDTGYDYAIQQQNLTNTVDEANRTTFFANGATDDLEKFKSLEGRAAADGLAPFKQGIEKRFQEAIESAPNPAVKASLARQARSITDQMYRYAAFHAASQTQKYNKETVAADAVAKGDLAITAAQNNDMPTVKQRLDESDQVVFNHEIQVNDRTIADMMVAKNRGHNVANMVETIASNPLDPGALSKASRLFKVEEKSIDPDSRRRIQNYLRAKLLPGAGREFGDQYMGRTTQVEVKPGKETPSPQEAAIEAARPKSPQEVVDLASKQAGLHERTDTAALSNFIGRIGGQKVNPAVTPWCAGWMNAVLKTSGYAGTNSLAARSFLDYGTPVKQPEKGDIVVFARGDKGHVAFYVGPGETPGTIKVLGGNQGDKVSVAEYGNVNVIGYRRLGEKDVVGVQPPTGPTIQPYTPGVTAGISVRPTVTREEAVANLEADPRMQANPELADHTMQHIMRTYSMFHKADAEKSDLLAKRMQDTMQETADRGFAKQEVTLQEAIALGGDSPKTREIYEKYVRNVSASKAGFAVADMAPKEASDYIEQSFRPKEGEEGYREKFEDYNNLIKRYKELSSEKSADPAGYALKHLPTVKDAWDRMGTAKTLPERAALAQDFARLTLAEQQRVGVEPYAAQIVPKSYIDSVNGTLMSPEKEGGIKHVKDTLEREATIWGPYWDQISGQVQKNATSFVRVAAAGITDRGWNMLSQAEKLGEGALLKLEDTDKKTDIDRQVREKLKPFFSTIAGDRGMSVQNDYFTTAEKLATAYLVSGTSTNASDAAKAAVDDIVNHRYAYKGTFRVPTDQALRLNADSVQLGSEIAKRRLVDFDLAGGNEAGIRALQYSGKWLTSPREDGLVLVDGDGRMARDNTGKQFILPWQYLENLAGKPESPADIRARHSSRVQFRRMSEEIQQRNPQ